MSERRRPIVGTKRPRPSTLARIPIEAVSLLKILSLRNITVEIIKPAADNVTDIDSTALQACKYRLP